MGLDGAPVGLIQVMARRCCGRLLGQSIIHKKDPAEPTQDWCLVFRRPTECLLNHGLLAGALRVLHLLVRVWLAMRPSEDHIPQPGFMGQKGTPGILTLLPITCTWETRLMAPAVDTLCLSGVIICGHFSKAHSLLHA